MTRDGEEFQPPPSYGFRLDLDELDGEHAVFSLVGTMKVAISREFWDKLGNPSRVTAHIHEDVVARDGYMSELDFKPLD